MSVLGYQLLPDLTSRRVPFWRQCLRGLSCCAFQTNELTGLIFIGAVLAYSWHMAVFYIIAVIVGTIVARLLTVLAVFRTDVVCGFRDAGILGFNSALMGLALGNFYQVNAALWIAVPVMAALAAVVTVVLARWLPFPFLAAPFIGCFWLLWPIASSVGMHKIQLSAFPVEPTSYIPATVASVGSTLFAPVILAGVLFLLGVLVANWRLAIVAAGGGLIAVSLAIHVHVVGGAINTGFIGFNAVLAALVVWVLVAEDLRLAALGAFVATWIFSFITLNAPFPALASGFVLGVWAIMLLGWINPRFIGKPAQAGPRPAASKVDVPEPRVQPQVPAGGRAGQGLTAQPSKSRPDSRRR
jgi:urea transporter